MRGRGRQGRGHPPEHSTVRGRRGHRKRPVPRGGRDRPPGSSRRSPGAATRRPGFALIAALWLLVAISAVGLELGLSARERRLATANVEESARARSAAEAGLAHARSRLEELLRRAERLDPGRRAALLDAWAFPQAAASDTVALGEARYHLELRDVGERLNLNRAGEEELRRFFRALRVDYGAADRIAQSILDWRDPDDAHRARGAEREDYERAGSAELPPNGPFQEIRELRFVHGMTPEIYERAREHLTLLGSGQVNLNTAPAMVLSALPGLEPEAVAVLLRLRRQGQRIGSLQDLERELPQAAREEFQAALPALLARTTTETREVEAVSEGWTEAGRVRVQMEGFFVRAGGSALLVSRRVR